ncbi:NIF domain protein, partial [Lipomyces arxii]|uniref:NIF domain protein n=1 Tax=Lipomyces arxii TaxID=56418 RepID=UPI0034CF1DE4
MYDLATPTHSFFESHDINAPPQHRIKANHNQGHVWCAMNSIQFISSQVERVAQQLQSPDEVESTPSTNVSTPDLVKTETEDKVESQDDSNRKWWTFFPLSAFVRFVMFVYAALASTLGVSDEGKNHDRIAVVWPDQDLADTLVTRAGKQDSIDEDENEEIDETGDVDIKRSIQTSSDSRPQSIYQQYPPRQQRSVRIRLTRKSSGSSEDAGSSLKSPTSPAVSLKTTKYPRTNPSRPLLLKSALQKTLILDLDETLIHSMSKGSKTSSGHMIEVKIDKQHAILYYVHKRPYCDDFLKKISQWYSLVVFTASVQEYADPVIDWLEQDRKLFKARYYRQHCTFRNGGYVKDISVVEPNLSAVMILDNSPISYYLHEDNAIAIEGWINDPSDLDLLHLVPFLNAMRFVNDVRTLIALRMGESAFSSIA